MPIGKENVMITTPRLILRPFTRDDALALYQYASQEDVGIHAGWQAHKSIEESAEILEGFLSQDATFAVVDKANGKVMGSISLATSDRVGNCRELGYVLGKDYWGNGYMTEAVNAMLEYGFGTLMLDFVVVHHYDFNDRSRRVIQKCGFEYEGTLHNAKQRFDGTILNCCWYYLTKDGYNKLSNKQ